LAVVKSRGLICVALFSPKSENKMAGMRQLLAQKQFGKIEAIPAAVW